MKRALLLFLAIALLAAGLVWFLRRSRQDAGAERTVFTYVKPQLRDVRQTLSLNGTISPVLSTEIKSEVNGRIALVHVNAGDTVKAGQLLVELDPGSLRAQIDSARLGIASAKLRVTRARQEFDRMTTLGKREFVNAKELENAETDFLLASNDLEMQGAQLRILEDNLKKISIVAPYDGTVLSVAARPGMVVTGAESGRDGNTLMELADLARLRVEAGINEIDVSAISLGMPVDITFESVRDLKAAGRITFISPATGRGSSGGLAGGGGGSPGGGGASREFPLQISVEQAGARVKPGMTARVQIETGRADKTLSVEIATVFIDFETDETYVFVRRPAGEPVKRKVVIGVRDGTYVEIKDGLAAADEVSRQRPSSDRRKGAERTAKKD
ncbi:MAG TPA: efflux RND transporter periplasmic adaptor subunit [Rariglobus sp.]